VGRAAAMSAVVHESVLMRPRRDERQVPELELASI
jgi:hypothetical protein